MAKLQRAIKRLGDILVALCQHRYVQAATLVLLLLVAIALTALLAASGIWLIADSNATPEDQQLGALFIAGAVFSWLFPLWLSRLSGDDDDWRDGDDDDHPDPPSPPGRPVHPPHKPRRLRQVMRRGESKQREHGHKDNRKQIETL